jgi:DNA mismatch repair protein MutS2
VIKRENNVRERERSVEKQSRQEARKYVLEARADIERTIAELKRKGAAAAADAALDEMGREARRRAEELAAKQANVLDRLDAEERAVERKRGRVPPAERGPVALNDAVEVGTLGGKVGRVLDLRGKDAVVAVGSLKVTVPLSTLRRTEAPLETAVSYIGDAPEVHVSTEINLLGLRADEAENAVLQALDSAVRADLKSLRIIHGKGTGALRALVDEMLRKDTRVREFHMGAWNEGGAGVTVAELT